MLWFQTTGSISPFYWPMDLHGASSVGSYGGREKLDNHVHWARRNVDFRYSSYPREESKGLP